MDGPWRIMVSEIGQRKTNHAEYHRDVESKGKNLKVKFLETESRKAVASGWGVRRQGEFGEKIQTFTYKVNVIWECNIKYGDYRWYHCVV